MTARRTLTSLVVALLAAEPVVAWSGPRVVCHGDGRCAVSALPPTLQDAEVLGYLKSGLTTTLAISLTAHGEHGQKLVGAGRIDVRFEPWEEVFDVVVAVPGAAIESRRLASEAGLHAWWRELEVSFALQAAARGSARVRVELIPFSEEEQADARRWYAETLRVAAAGRAGSDGESGSSALSSVLDALTLTSIKRQGVLRFSWTATIERVR